MKYIYYDNNTFKDGNYGFYMRKRIIFALIFLICLNFVYATPQVPVVFSGTISYSINPSVNLQGQEINVSIGAGNWKVGNVEANNHYEIAVDPLGVAGDIYFYIGGIKALETGQYSMGAFIFKDLTINQLPLGVSDNINSNDESDGSSGSSSSSSRSSSSSSSTIKLSSSSNLNNQNTQTQFNYSTESRNIDSKKENSFIEIITSGKLLIALIIVVLVLGILVFVIPKSK